jgi:hypothetical protein
MSKVIVRLWDHVGTGIIIGCPSGIVYANQTCGQANCDLAMEGIFVPVGNDTSLDGKLLSAEIRLNDYFRGAPHLGNGAVHGITDADAALVESALHENLLLRNLTVDRQRLHESYEGWVCLRIDRPESQPPLFEGLSPFPLSGVLTWSNIA